MYWWFVNFIFWNSVLGVAACTRFLVLAKCEASPGCTVFRNLNIEHSPVVSLGNVRLLDFEWSAQDSLKKYEHLVIHRRSLDWLEIPSPTEDFGLAVACTVGFGSAIGEPSLELVSWPLFDMALCFSIGSERKLLKWLPREHRETHDVEQTKKMVPLVTREICFG